MNRTPIASLALVAGILCGAASSRAAILEDFQFGDTNGTLLGAALNSANNGNNWLVHANTVDSAVESGSFRIEKQAQTGQAANALEIANVTSGKVWLVAEISGWFYTPTPSTPPERMRFAFMDNDPASTGGSTVTAEMNIDRGGNGLVLIGDALGTGAVDPAGSYAMALDRSTPLTLALELDADTDTFTVYHREGLGPWGSLGPGVLGERSAGIPREARSVRFAFTGTFGDSPDEFFGVDRIYVTTTNPIPEPSCLVLTALVASAALVGRRRCA